ncbi:MAG: neutral/alkaline non-lysosomal ceramidase N-terminal domain-containing protein [Actinobacteria bacterium]|nr:neutral/alkaline non-lysosomal ceramidase N-terminal domain-containing protein [Actinomycetota bacterium]
MREWGSEVLTAGAATVAVDVPPGTPMSGYAARLSPSTGMQDPLTVRALVVDDIGLVVVDCCALREATCDKLRAVRPAGVRDVVVTATHTHSGPCLTPGGLGTFAPDVLETGRSAYVEALTSAYEHRIPVTVRYGERRSVGVGRNRRHADLNIDPPVQVVSFDAADHTVATLVTYPMHPVVLSAANTLVSADYVGPLRDEVEAALPGSVCIFAQGCAGDVNDDRHSAEEDFSAAPSPGRSVEAAAATGRTVARAALDALSTATTLRPASTSMRTLDVPLELTVLDPAEVAAERDEWTRLVATLPPERSALYETWAAWADAWLDAPRDSDWSGRVGLITIGDLRIATLPGEPFLAVADRVHGRLGERTLVLGYCDGVSGYLPTADEYGHGGYEVSDAHRYYGMAGPFAPGSAERLADAAVSLSEN